MEMQPIIQLAEIHELSVPSEPWNNSPVALFCRSSLDLVVMQNGKDANVQTWFRKAMMHHTRVGEKGNLPRRCGEWVAGMEEGDAILLVVRSLFVKYEFDLCERLMQRYLQSFEFS